jgi:hypothetical protein
MKTEAGVSEIEWNLSDSGMEKLLKYSWDRLPENIKAAAAKQIQRVLEPDEPSAVSQLKPARKSNPADWCPAFFNAASRQICFAKNECRGLSDEVIIGAFIHAVAHAYQTQNTPGNLEAIEYAGDGLPCRIGFARESAALMLERDRRQNQRSK